MQAHATWLSLCCVCTLNSCLHIEVAGLGTYLPCHAMPVTTTPAWHVAPLHIAVAPCAMHLTCCALVPVFADCRRGVAWPTWQALAPRLCLGLMTCLSRSGGLRQQARLQAAAAGSQG